MPCSWSSVASRARRTVTLRGLTRREPVYAPQVGVYQTGNEWPLRVDLGTSRRFCEEARARAIPSSRAPHRATNLGRRHERVARALALLLVEAVLLPPERRLRDGYETVAVPSQRFSDRTVTIRTRHTDVSSRLVSPHDRTPCARARCQCRAPSRASPL